MASVEELKNFRFSEDRSVVDDESKILKCNDPSCTHIKILDNFGIQKKQDGNINKMFNFAPGETYVPKINDSNSWARINDMKKCKSLFGDEDKDGVMNFADCKIFDKKQQGLRHKLSNFIEGSGFQDKTLTVQQQQATKRDYIASVPKERRGKNEKEKLENYKSFEQGWKQGTKKIEEEEKKQPKARRFIQTYGRRVPPVPVKQTFRSLKKEGGEFFGDIGKVTGKMSSKKMSSKMGLGGTTTRQSGFNMMVGGSGRTQGSGFNMMMGLEQPTRRKVKIRKKKPKYRYVNIKPETGEQKIKRILG